jgi:hypothetical protein
VLELVAGHDPDGRGEIVVVVLEALIELEHGIQWSWNTASSGNDPTTAAVVYPAISRTSASVTFSRARRLALVDLKP